MGRAIARNAAAGLKRVSLELGGKTPHLVFDDADPTVVVPSIVASMTVFAGQFCMTGSRILVQSGIAEKLTHALAEHLAAVRPGPAGAVVQRETFGPVQTIQVFDTEAEAIDLANDTEYGLSACVWSRDVDLPVRVARKLDVGLVSINSWANLAVEFEEGGFKSSGLGRLGGIASLDDFLEYKQISHSFIPQTH